MNRYYVKKAIRMLNEGKTVYLGCNLMSKGLIMSDGLMLKLAPVSKEGRYTEEYGYLGCNVFVNLRLCFIQDVPNNISCVDDLEWRDTFENTHRSLHLLLEEETEFLKEKEVPKLVNSAIMLQELEK